MWPAWVRFLVGDAVDLLPGLGQFALIFADAEGGKWHRLDLTLEAIAPSGLLVLDDVEAQAWKSETARHEHAAKSSEILQQLQADTRFLTAKVDQGPGVILATRRCA